MRFILFNILKIKFNFKIISKEILIYKKIKNILFL